MKKNEGIILAGMHSSSGKTAVTCLVLAALRQRGIAIQPFKVGPDFIDPGFHAAIAGVPSRNLDACLMGREMVIEDVNRAMDAGSVPVIEGVMGLFDGSDPVSDTESTMELARDLDWPIILVVPCAKAARSLAAAIRGFIAEAGPDRIAGLILNQVSGKSHADYLRAALSPLDVPILGIVSKCSDLNWPERYLGLQSSTELHLPGWERCAKLAEQFLDVQAISSFIGIPNRRRECLPRRASAKIKIGVARDEVFHFYYASNLEFLEESGAELVFFSPLRDRALPQVDAIIVGGGFPEIFVEQLAANFSFRESVNQAIENGLPCYAECGGLMYMAERLVTREGKEFPMVGVVPGEVEMTSRLQNFGYCECRIGEEIYRGHEFHHSLWRQENEHANLWRVRHRRMGAERTEGFTTHRLHASYVHLDYRANRELILTWLGFVDSIAKPETQLQEAFA